MKPLRPEHEIMKHWPADTEPLVTIRCITYNHERFIEDAIEGFLIQETDFPFEIILHDDASTDRTAEIVREYARAYPKIIRAILQTENQYSQGKRPSEILDPLSRGKYIALCEGDDYWTDPNKLSIQVGFLERHPDYVITGHDAFVIDEYGNQIKNSQLPVRDKRDFGREELILGKASVLNMSRVYRNVIHGRIPERSMVANGDTFFLSLIGHFGKSKYLSEIKPAVYRKHPGGIWSMAPPAQRLDAQINTHFWIYRYYARIGETRYARHYWRKYLGYVFRRTTSPDLLKALIRKWLRWGWY